MLDVYQIGRWFILAEETEPGRFEAPMTREGRRMTGCRAVFGSLAYCAGSPTVYRYRTRRSAKRALRAIAGMS